MKILSLFDGISCGYLALQRAGIFITSYYASEIDKFAIKCSSQNNPDIIHIGSITDISYKDGILTTANGTYKVDEFDLVIGGSPCQSFSNAGDGTGFNGKSGLFYEFVRVLKEVNPKYFLLENVTMKKEWEKIITDEMGVEPILINSHLVSAQNRKRLYWTNIPNIIQPTDKNIILEDILETNNTFTERPMTLKPNSKVSKDGLHHIGTTNDIKGNESIKRVYSSKGKAPTLTTSGGGHREPKVMVSDTTYRKLTPLECERLQTLPDNYTGMLSNTQRYKSIGNGWTVDVITQIFKNMDYNVI